MSLKSQCKKPPTAWEVLKFALEFFSAVGTLFGHLASMAQKLSFALGATVENKPLNKTCNEKCNGESEEYLQKVASYINNKINEYGKIEGLNRFLTLSGRFATLDLRSRLRP